MSRFESKLWHKQRDPAIAGRIGCLLATAQLEANQPRTELARELGSMFEGKTLDGLDGDCFDSLVPVVYDGAPLINNRAASIVETLQSKLAALDEPRPQFVITDGTYEQHRQAVWLDRFVEALYYQPQCNGLYANMWQLWRHAFLLAAAATGTVAVKIYPDFRAKKINAELHSTLDMWVDPFEVRYSGPLTYGESTMMDAEPLLDKYSKSQAKTQAILSAMDQRPARGSTNGKARRSSEGQVLVHELWRVRTLADEPGKYLQCVGNQALEFEDYAYSTPPFAFYHFRRRLGGFWGAAAIDRFHASVIRENQVINRMDEGEARSSTTVIYYDPKVQGADKIARPGHVLMVPYNSEQGSPPQPYTLPWYPQTAPELRALHAQNAHDASGVAAMQTTGTAQQGLTAAVAIRTVLSLLNERLAPQQRDIVQAQAVDSAYLFARAAKELYDETGSFDAVWYGKGAAKTLPGEDCLSLPQEIMTAQVRPVSEKKNSPEDRLQLAQELVSQGVITGGHWLGVMRHMDTIAASKQFTKVEDWAENFFDKVRYAKESELGKPGFYMAPLKGMDLDYAMALTMDAALDAQIAGMPEVRRKWIFKLLADLQSKIAQRNAMMQPPPQAAPPVPGVLPPPGNAPPVAA